MKLNCEILNGLIDVQLSDIDFEFVDMLDSLQNSLEQRINKQSGDVSLSSDQKVVFGNSLASELFKNYSKLDTALNDMISLDSELKLNKNQKNHIMALFTERLHSILDFLDPEE